MHDILQREHATLAQTVTQLPASLEQLERCIDLIALTFEQGGKLLAAGNGGSACDALHLCEELVGRYRDNRKALGAVCLSSDATTLTCVGNDFGFDAVFARQVEALGRPGDVLVLFTSSGNSANLLCALRAAKAGGVKTIVFSGRGGGKLAGLPDAEWIVPSNHGARVQEMHTWGLHVALEMVEERLFSVRAQPPGHPQA